MNTRIRQTAVVVFALLDIASSVWLGGSLDQGSDPSRVYFLPFDLTFAIWGLIFISQLVYAIYQALPGQAERSLHQRIGWWVALNAALTAGWILAAGSAGQEGDAGFQPLLIVATALILVVMLFSLTQVFIIFRITDGDVRPIDRWLVQFPLTVFFAWLNVAMIANTTAALDALGFPSEPNGALWAVAMLIVVAVLASLLIRFTRSPMITCTYTGVIVWALIGIFFNNIERSSLVAGVSIAVAIVVMVVAGRHLIGDRQVASINRPTGA